MPQRRFGIIEGINDKGYITTAYHVHVTEPINAFDKLKFEAQFQHLSPGGAISYVEVPDMQNNLEAVLQVMKFIYDNIIYAELNTKSDYCQVCGWDGEIQIVEEHGKLVWKCPKCGNTDQDKMNVAGGPAATSGPSSGTRAGPRRFATGCCICKRERSGHVLRRDQGLRHRQRRGGSVSLFVSGCTNRCRHCFSPDVGL